MEQAYPRVQVYVLHTVSDKNLRAVGADGITTESADMHYAYLIRYS